MVKPLIDQNGPDRTTSLFPEIAYDLMVNEKRGAAKLIGEDQVDTQNLRQAARFCKANSFFWDGAITESQNLRSFFFEMAGYHLLDFMIVGGRFSLYPAVPFNGDYTIKHLYKPEIKALFTDGNLRNLKVTFLSPEERQLFRATVLWRQETENGFPQTRTYTATLKDGGTIADPEEKFDLSSFCTSEHHAKTFAHYSLMLRRWVDHSITFETTPQAAMSLEPGQYFKVSSHATHTSRFDNGTITPDGYLQGDPEYRQNQDILYWKQGTEGIRTGKLNINADRRVADKNLWGSIFTIVTSSTTVRVYKCESLSYAEDGLVEVNGTHMELDEQGHIRYLDWVDDDFNSETA